MARLGTEEKDRIKEGIKTGVGLFFLAASLWILLKMISFCFSPDIWYDEVFSLGMISRPYGEIAALTAQDVHPPFYYWYLKAFSQLGGLLAQAVPVWAEEGILGVLSSSVVAGTIMQEDRLAVILAKLASALPMAGLWALAAGRIRKRLGLMTAGLFAYCVFSMPQLTAYGMEIRMYSLALFLVTLALLSAYDICSTKAGEGFGGLWITGILTAYTHYFSCLGIVLLYLLLLVFLRKDKKAVKKWLLCVFFSVMAYLPWLGVMLRQFSSVSGSYWIEPLTWRSFPGCVKYIFLPAGGYVWLNYCLAVVMILVFCLLLALFFCSRGKQGREGSLVLLGLGMPVGAALAGIALSLLISPMFVYRYLIPFLGGFWLVFAIVLARNRRLRLWLPACILVLYIGHINVSGVFWEEENKVTQAEITLEGLEQVGEEDILIFNFNHLQGVVGYYRSNPGYLLYSEAEPLIQELYGESGTLSQNAKIQGLLEHSAGKVWFLGSFNSREDIVEEWKNLGIEVTQEGSYLLERYWFNLYCCKSPVTQP